VKRVEIVPRGSGIGAEVRGLDLPAPLGAGALARLNQLFVRVGRPEYGFRLRWQMNTLAMWDNRSVQHCALNDYHGFRRVMHRIIVEGDPPLAPPP
jgi:alpha-ketoglutarate-dependent taurine dioxygenase